MIVVMMMLMMIMMMMMMVMMVNMVNMVNMVMMSPLSMKECVVPPARSCCSSTNTLYPFLESKQAHVNDDIPDPMKMIS